MTVPSASQYTPATLALQQTPYVAATSSPLIATCVAGTGVTITSPAGQEATGAGTSETPWILGPFEPQLSRPIHLVLNAIGASGTAQVLRSTDGGTTMLPITSGGAIAGDYAFGLGAPQTGIVVNEPIRTETDAAATFYLAVTLTAGTLTVRKAQ
ncbi:hypothetical protein [Novosphingobium sp. FSW06-99]|uniref:hypothetical protein n=1 Tax=Novosphingobium sp. FSW06-99 TaxID=1739113 RepID=UPI00076C9684|nr:hypothetical protein [Novosphingobium sp. FSW06-99]KUR80746.1 hypothetical protein AQZ49_01580 [Novosphingobium sp. FSW06-99]